jgi:hypothetical protein
MSLLLLGALSFACAPSDVEPSPPVSAAGVSGSASGSSATGTGGTAGVAAVGGAPVGGAGAAPVGGSSGNGGGGVDNTGGAAAGGVSPGGVAGGDRAGSSAGGSAGAATVCQMLQTEYAGELEEQLACKPNAAAQCTDRVAAAPGCECRVFIEPSDPFAIEQLSNVANGWFDADCSGASCPANCSSAAVGTCQADASSPLGGRCVTP